MFTLNAQQLSTWQRCRRRYLLDRAWRVLRRRPRALFAHCFREAVLRISQGMDAEQATLLARAKFMEQAAEPGLDVAARDTYRLASDFCAMLSTSLLATARSPLYTIRKGSLLPLAGSRSTEIAWQPSSLLDDAGALHRWVITDCWDGDAIARELHSWQVIGDMAICDAPLTLHIVVIGQSREGRLQSPWCKAFAHPMIAGRFRFQKNVTHPEGPRALAGDHWRPTWLSDLQTTPAEWLRQMDSDAVTMRLLQDAPVRQPSPTAAREVLRQIASEAQAMQQALGSDPMDVPMSRPACDGLVRCPYQEACYVESPTADLSGLGLYQLRPPLDVRGAGAEESSAPPRTAHHASG